MSKCTLPKCHQSDSLGLLLYGQGHEFDKRLGNVKGRFLPELLAERIIAHIERPMLLNEDLRSTRYNEAEARAILALLCSPDGQTPDEPAGEGEK